MQDAAVGVCVHMQGKIYVCVRVITNECDCVYVQKMPELSKYVPYKVLIRRICCRCRGCACACVCVCL